VVRKEIVQVERLTLSKVGVQLDAVLFSLQAIE
jgi:hypothetical protein